MILSSDVDDIELGIEIIELLLQSKASLDDVVIVDGKEYKLRKFPFNKYGIHEKVISILKKAGWKGSFLGFF